MLLIIMKVNHNEIFKYYQLGIYPHVERLYAFGDIHGDFNAFVLTLKKANLINDKYHWCGGNAHVVQVGDILDRKIRSDETISDEDSEFKIISLILKLQLESYIDGGGFHPVIGNHELMNIFGIFDYVSPMGMKHFKNSEDRSNYFRIGGDFCKYLACGWNPIVKIGDFIFCHGGLSYPISNKYSIQDINFIMRDTLYGNEHHIHQNYFQQLFLDQYSILWNRTYSIDLPKERENIELRFLNKILEKYDAKYLVIGHTPQEKGINVKYNGKVYCIDTAMSEAFGKKNNKLERIHFIEINRSNKKIAIF